MKRFAKHIQRLGPRRNELSMHAVSRLFDVRAGLANGYLAAVAERGRSPDSAVTTAWNGRLYKPPHGRASRGRK